MSVCEECTAGGSGTRRMEEEGGGGRREEGGRKREGGEGRRLTRELSISLTYLVSFKTAWTSRGDRGAEIRPPKAVVYIVCVIFVFFSFFFFLTIFIHLLCIQRYKHPENLYTHKQATTLVCNHIYVQHLTVLKLANKQTKDNINNMLFVLYC